MNKGIIQILLSGMLFLAWSLCYSQKGDQEQIDSLLMELAKSKNDTNKIYLFNKIFYMHTYFKPEEGLKYEKPALEIAEKMNWKSGIAGIKSNAGRLYWRLGKFNEALKRHYGALKIYEEESDKKSAGNTLIFIGQDYADANFYPHALRYFEKALKVSEEIGDSAGMSNIYGLFSWVYNQQGNYLESSKSNLEAFRIYEKLGDAYGASIALSNIGDDYLKLGNYPDAIKYYLKGLPILERAGDYINLATSYSTLGNAYSQSGNLPDALKSHFTALKISKEINNGFLASVSYSNIGKIHQEQGNYNEALKNYLLADSGFKSVSNKQELASLYSDMGICYTKLKKLDEAKIYFKKANVLSGELVSKVSISNYYKGMEMLDSATNNWHDAYFNYKRYVTIRDSMLNYESAKKIVGAQMQYEAEKKEIADKAEQEKKDIRQRDIRNSIAAGFIGAFIFGIIVLRQRNKISKARKRSDELLLNILPEEVAEELKAKGSADAKQFDEVTVMFTDFKNFTQISEKLSPQELVSEIDSCFKAFDNIISKYNIEKIKTIGDSYMCAGGLPVTNKTHAEDVVRAAIEIRDFIAARPALSFGEGLGVRLGIHTGPVVAGIVGVKKFAYDIWGDTVNIASRMESSGEAGKINVSGSTYKLVKDKFNCIHRGKIVAKNKGKIDMYFVNSNN